MHVSLSVDALSPSLSGIGRYCWELARGLGHDARVDSMSYFTGARWVGDPASLLASSHPKTSAPHWSRSLKRWFNHGRFSDRLVHSPNFFLPEWGAGGVVTVHDLSVFKHPETHPADRIRAFDTGFAASVGRAGLILTDCEWIRQEVLTFTGLPAARVMAVPLGIAPEFHPRDAAEVGPVIARFGLLHGQYGLCVSTLEPRKRIGHLVRCWADLPAQLRSRYPLVIAGGDGWCNDSLMQQIEQGQAEGWLHYLGYVNEAELPLLYAGARIFAYPSQYEGFGLPPLEAMASGVPTLVSAGTCLEETAGPAAVLADPEDDAGFRELLIRLLSDERWRSELSSAGVKLASQYDWKRCIEQTVDAYQFLLQG